MLVGPFVDILLELAETGGTDADLESVRAVLDAELRQPGAAGRLVEAAAHALLTGVDVWTPDDLLTDLAATTLEDVQDVAKQALASAMVIVPRGSEIGRGDFVPAPKYSG